MEFWNFGLFGSSAPYRRTSVWGAFLLLEEEESEEEKVERITPPPPPPFSNISFSGRELGVPAPKRKKRQKRENHQISPKW